MKIADRIKLITSIAEHLYADEWTYIDLVLESCGAPTSNVWESGDKRSYIISMIKGLSDGALETVAEAIGIKGPDADASDLHPPGDGRFHIFISHLFAHQKFAAEMQAAFKRFGISSFVAHNDVEPTVEWQNAIEKALRTCDVLVALLHPDFHKSNWTDQEIGFVMGRNKPAFTVMLGATPYGFISRFQAFQGKDKTAKDIASEVFGKLLVHKETSSGVALALARAFENSGSYARSVELVEYLEKLDSAPLETQSAVEAALKGNSQVYGEGFYAVPDRTKKLLTKWKSKP